MAMKIRKALDSLSPRVRVLSYLSTLSDEDVVTPSELKDLLGIARQTCEGVLKDWVKIGKLDSIKILRFNYYGTKKAIKSLKARFRERYGTI